MIRTFLSILLLTNREQLCQETWMFEGTSRQRRYIPVNRIPLSEEKRMVLDAALEPCPSLPKPEDSRCYHSEGLLKPKLMTRKEVLATCLHLAYCGCSREGGCYVNRRCTCIPRHINVVIGAETTRTLQQRPMKHDL